MSSRRDSRSGHSRSQSRLACENLISIDPTAITTNFRIINEQLEVLEDIVANVQSLLDWRTAVEAKLESVKTSSEKNNFEVRNLLRNQSKRQSALPDPLLLLRQSGVDLIHNIAQRAYAPTEVSRLSLGQEAGQSNPSPEWTPKSQFEQFRQTCNEQAEEANDKLERLQLELHDVRADTAPYERVMKLQDSLNVIVNQQQQSAVEVSELQKKIEELTCRVQKQPIDYLKSIEELRVQAFRKIETIGSTVKRKANHSDLEKLEELLVGLVERTATQLSSTIPSQSQTKKALIFLEKRLNRFCLKGCESVEGDPLLAGRTWCLSCSKEEAKSKPKVQVLQQRDNQSMVSGKKPSMPCCQLPSGKTSGAYMPQSAKYSSQPHLTKQNKEGPSSIPPPLETNVMIYYGQQPTPNFRVQFDYMNVTRGGIRAHLRAALLKEE